MREKSSKDSRSSKESSTKNKTKLVRKPPPDRLKETQETVKVYKTADTVEKVANVAGLLVNVFSEILAPSWDITDLLPWKRGQRKQSLEQRKTELVKELLQSGIDPIAFDVLLSNEMNRRLKVRFGITFLTLTFFFTFASYSIVVLDGINNWGISDIAITTLIIETPIQFVGLLYIIARNLFPEEGISRNESSRNRLLGGNLRQTKTETAT